MPEVQIGKLRLKKRHEFLRIQRGGSRFRGQFIVFAGRHLADENSRGRFGLVATKTIGKAHERNRVKRRLRHLLLLFPQLIRHRDLVLLATNSCVDASFDGLKKDFVDACKHMDTSVRSNRKKHSQRVTPNSSQGETHVYRVTI